MNRSSWMKVFAMLLLAAALTGVSVAAAQQEGPAAVDEVEGTAAATANFNYVITASGSQQVTTYPPVDFTFFVHWSGMEVWYTPNVQLGNGNVPFEGSGENELCWYHGHAPNIPRSVSAHEENDPLGGGKVNSFGIMPDGKTIYVCVTPGGNWLFHNDYVVHVVTTGDVYHKTTAEIDSPTFSGSVSAQNEWVPVGCITMGNFVPPHGGSLDPNSLLPTQAISNDSRVALRKVGWDACAGVTIQASTNYSEVGTQPWSRTQSGTATVNASDGELNVATTTLQAPNRDTIYSVTDDSPWVETWMDGNELYARTAIDWINASGQTAGTVAGKAFESSDIMNYRFDQNVWNMKFDASDVGVTVNVGSFAKMPDANWLMNFTANATLPGVVGTVKPQDIVRLQPTKMGETTSGTFAPYFKGYDYGLSGSAERIDAVALIQNGDLLISTTGAASVPAECNATAQPGAICILTAADEDLLRFSRDPASGNYKWSLFLDGSTIPGLAVEDVNGAWLDVLTGDLYVNIVGAFNLGGVKGNGRDIVRLAKNGDTYTPSLWWDGSAKGYSTNIDGIELSR